MTTNINYSYDNPTHLQVTKTTTIRSDSKAIVTQNKYPADYTDATYGTDLLRSQSINNKLVEQITTRDGNTEMQVVTSYKNSNGSVLPDQVSIAASGRALEARLKYNNYDNQGNIIEVSKVSSPITAYLWGYNQQYPIAEVKNATYQNLIDVLGQATINQLAGSNPGTDVQVRNLLNPLRTDTRLKGAQITTYTYNPLVGMTSSTDAKGVTTTYEYDSFQRLMNIKDKDGNIVKHMDYHYQGQ